MIDEREEKALCDICTLTEALERCWKGSGVPAKEMAFRLGIEYGHFVRMFREHDSRHFPPDLIVRLMQECRSLLPLEWLAWRMGYRLHDQSLTAILKSISEAFMANGKVVKFDICESGRVERA